MKKILIALIFSITFLLFFLFFLVYIGVSFSRVFELMLSVKIPYLFLSLIADIVFILFYVFSTYFLFCTYLKFRFSDIFKASIFAWFTNTLLPFGFITGDLVRIAYLRKKYKLNFFPLIFLTFFHRLLSFYAFFLIFSFSFLYTASYFHVSFFAFKREFSLLLILATLVTISLLLLRKKTIFKILHHFLKRRKKEIENLYALLTKKRNFLILSFILIFLHMISGVFIPYFIFLSLSYYFDFLLLTFSYSLYGIADNLPLLVPANIGLLDTAMIASFVFLGVDKNIATTATLIIRSVTIIFELLFAGLISYICGIKEILSYQKIKKNYAS